MQDKILNELEVWLCGYLNAEKAKIDFEGKVWELILKGSREK